MRGVLRARRGRGKQKDKVVNAGKDSAEGQRQRRGNMGHGEFPWGVMGRDEWEGASAG